MCVCIDYLVLTDSFQPTLAVDSWATACSSYKRNFPRTSMFHGNITDFINDGSKGPFVDILHISPPCQFWSPMHTHAGKNDDANIAALFVIIPLLEKLRPRMVTLEQTFGLMHERHAPFFNSVIHHFTCSNYSIQW